MLLGHISHFPRIFSKFLPPSNAEEINKNLTMVRITPGDLNEMYNLAKHCY